MTSVFLELIQTSLTILLLLYTAVAISHYVIQLAYAHRTYRRQGSAAFRAAHPDLDLAVDIVVPVYNEEPELLEACLASALAQDHRGPVQVIVVDDGSPNRASLDGIYDRYEDLGVRVVRSRTNVGKRHAQALALPLCEGEILVTLDSDSVLAPDAVRMLTRQFRDPKVGAATGMIDVSNRTANLLTRIQRIRYWMAFNQERAAQTWFRTVMCCSGPLAAYRRVLVDQVRDAYLSQRYGGVACTYGDDRHLTNLVLGLGYDTVYDAGAKAWTNVPTSVHGFARQQLRWNKSFYRELIWTMPFIAARPWYSRFDLAAQVAMPIMLTVTAGSALVMGVLTDPTYIVRYLALIAGVALIRATYAAVRERDVRFYLFLVYGYVSAFLLMSVRFRALATLTDARWGTRGPIIMGKAEAAFASVMAGVQPLVAAAQTVAWPEPRRVRDWAGGATRLDGAWRAGLRMRTMADPMGPIPGAGLPAGFIPADPSPGGTVASDRPGRDATWRRRSVDGSAWTMMATPAVAAAPSVRPVLQPLGRWSEGPTCRHAVAATSAGTRCKACGATWGPRFAAADAPAAALARRLRERGPVIVTWLTTAVAPTPTRKPRQKAVLMPAADAVAAAPRLTRARAGARHQQAMAAAETKGATARPAKTTRPLRTAAQATLAAAAQGPAPAKVARAKATRPAKAPAHAEPAAPAKKAVPAKARTAKATEPTTIAAPAETAAPARVTRPTNTAAAPARVTRRTSTAAAPATGAPGKVAPRAPAKVARPVKSPPVVEAAERGASRGGRRRGVTA